MASFDFDQAEGLRRMLAGARPCIASFLSATPERDKNAMLVNLAASLASVNSEVLLVDASAARAGVASRLGARQGMTLMEAARLERLLQHAVQKTPQGFGVVALGHAATCDEETGCLDNAFAALAAKTDVLLVDAELSEAGFPVAAMGSGEIVIQVSPDTESIKNAYAIIKRLNAQLGRRPFSLLVTGATEIQAKAVFVNLSQAASKYLAVELRPLGSVPADDHVARAAQLGRTVIDAFPLAGASVAFRRLAERFTARSFRIDQGA